MTKPQNRALDRLFSAVLGRPYLILALTAAFWGGNLVAGKMAVGHVDPFALSVMRWGGALLAVLPFAVGPVRREIDVLKRHWPLLLFYGALGFSLYNVVMYVAVHYTSGVNASIEQVAVNIFVMIGNFIIFKVRVRALQLAGVALTVIGVALTATDGQLGRILELDIKSGDAMVLSACVIYAVYSLSLRYRPPMGWITFLVATIGAAVLTTLIVQVAFGGGLGVFVAGLADITPLGWAIVVYVVLFPSILAQIFYVRGVELIGANRASLFINLIPVFGTIGSVLLLGERLAAYHLIAGALIVIGIVVAEYAVLRGQTALPEPLPDSRR